MLTDEIIWCPKFQNNQVKWGGAINETRLAVSGSLLKQDNSYTSLCYYSPSTVACLEFFIIKSKKQEDKQNIDTDITSLTLKIRKIEA